MYKLWLVMIVFWTIVWSVLSGWFLCHQEWYPAGICLAWLLIYTPFQVLRYRSMKRWQQEKDAGD